MSSSAFMARWFLFVLLNLCAAAVAAVAALQDEQARSEPIEFVAKWITFYMGAIILVETALGILGRLDVWSMAAVLLALAVIALLLARKVWRLGPLSRLWQAGIALAAQYPRRPSARSALLLAAWLAIGISVSALAEVSRQWDSFGYHMPMVADWLTQGALRPFYLPASEVANSYFPGNGELLYLWVVAPFQNDLLVRLVNTGLWFGLGCAAYRLARQLNASAEAALASTLLLLFTPVVLGQATELALDMASTAVFLLALGHLLDFSRSLRTSALAAFGVAAGVFLGIKYSAPASLALLLMALLAILVYRSKALGAPGIARSCLAAAPGIVALGGYWYVRNFVLAQSPLFPISLRVLGQTLFAGPPREYSNQLLAYLGQIPLGVLLEGALSSYGVGFWLAGIAGLLLVPGLLRQARARGLQNEASRQRAFHLLLVGALMLGSLLLYTVTPYSIMRYSVTQSITPVRLAVGARFSLAAGSLCCLLLAYVLTRRGNLLHVLWPLFTVSIALGLVYSRDPYTANLFAGSVLTVPRLALAAAIVTAVVAAAQARPERAWAAWLCYAAPPWRTGVLAAVAMLALGGALWFAQGHREQYRYALYAHPFPGQREGWEWIDEHLHGVKIAYSGIPVAYPLYGSRLENMVRYVNVTGGLEDRFDDFFARNTGYRENPDYETWVRNLKTWGAQYAVVSPSVVEAEWMQQHGEAFSPVFTSPSQIVYEIK